MKKPVSKIRRDIFDAWKVFTPKSLEEMLTIPRLPLAEFEEVKEKLQPVIDRFDYVNEIELAEYLDFVRVLAFVKDEYAGWVLGLYLLAICEVLDHETDIHCLTFTFYHFITGVYFDEVLEGLTHIQRELLIGVAELCLIELRTQKSRGMSASEEFIPKIEELLKKW